MHRFTLAALALAAIMLGGAAAFAQQTCFPADIMIETARETYGEVPHSAGITERGLIVVLVDEDDGSWTIVIRPNATHICPLASGTNWMELPAPAKGDPS